MEMPPKTLDSKAASLDCLKRSLSSRFSDRLRDKLTESAEDAALKSLEVWLVFTLWK